MSVLYLSVGLVLLIAGAELLVRGASQFAKAAGFSPLLIGLTIVAYGTSAPELAVSVKANLAQQPDIALGNVVGSNIFNILFILGISALIVPLACAEQLVRLDVPIMIVVSALTWVLALDGKISSGEGALLLIGILVYTAFVIREGQKSGAQAREKTGAASVAIALSQRKGKLLSVVFIVIGLVLVVLGARWLVDGAAALARWLGVSELVIGLTIVGAGTSFPELATSAVASIRRERDIAVGNVVGSNIFNILAVLGAAAIVAPEGLAVAPAALRFDIPVMLASALICLPIFFTHGEISRWEGALFLAYYVAYALYLFLAASHHQALTFFNTAFWCLAVPLTALALLLSIVHSVRTHRPREKMGQAEER